MSGQTFAHARLDDIFENANHGFSNVKLKLFTVIWDSLGKQPTDF